MAESLHDHADLFAAGKHEARGCLAKEGARHHGYTGVRGYHPLLAVAAGSGDVLMARLREGRAHTARGAAHFLRETIGRVRAAGASGQLTMRADSGFYAHAVVAVCRKLGVRFSITIRQQPSMRRLIEAIPEAGWTPIEYWLAGGAVPEIVEPHPREPRLFQQLLKPARDARAAERSTPLVREHQVALAVPPVLADAQFPSVWRAWCARRLCIKAAGAASVRRLREVFTPSRRHPFGASGSRAIVWRIVMVDASKSTADRRPREPQHLALSRSHHQGQLYDRRDRILCDCFEDRARLPR